MLAHCTLTPDGGAINLAKRGNKRESLPFFSLFRSGKSNSIPKLNLHGSYPFVCFVVKENLSEVNNRSLKAGSVVVKKLYVITNVTYIKIYINN